MNKFKLAIFAGAVVAIGLVSVLAVQADTTPLAVSCSAAVSNNQITWTASPSGGNSPYSLVWSGDSSVAGSTSTSIVATYTANSTYTAMIQATDASSTIATSTCSGTVTSFVTATPTSTLDVVIALNNTAGGSAVSSDFTGNVSGANANPSSFTGSPTGTSVVLNANSTYSVGASSIINYVASESGICSGPIAAGTTATCTVTETFVQPTATTPATSTLPRVNPPSLSIGANGVFTGKGMTVTSVASGSFQAEVWGITYTINWSGNLFPQFYFRGGNSATSTTNPIQQVAVGDEVGVSGKITSGSPMVVTANSVRDYSITQPRMHPMPLGGKGSGHGNKSSTTVSSSVGFSAHRNNFWSHLGLQNLFGGKK